MSDDLTPWDSDRWKARKAELEKEISGLKLLADNTTAEFAELRDDRDRLKAENERLREALKAVIKATWSGGPLRHIAKNALAASEPKEKS